MSNNKLKVAVIGTGNIGKGLAANLVKGNRPVIIASRKTEDAETLANNLGELATATTVKSAINEADIIILALWFDTIKELLNTYSSEFQGKIIIDPSNPIAPDGDGGFKKIIGENESSGEILAVLLPKGASSAKAFGTLGAGSLESEAHRTSEKAVLFYATDDTSINGTIEELIRDSGFDSYRIGGIDQSIRIEVFGDLHEFGALGKAVTLKEVNSEIANS